MTGANYDLNHDSETSTHLTAFSLFQASSEHSLPSIELWMLISLLIDDADIEELGV